MVRAVELAYEAQRDGWLVLVQRERGAVAKRAPLLVRRLHLLVVEAVQHCVGPEVLLVVVRDAEERHRMAVVQQLVAIRDTLVRAHEELEAGAAEELADRALPENDGGAAHSVELDVGGLLRRVGPEYVVQRVEGFVVRR